MIPPKFLSLAKCACRQFKQFWCGFHKEQKLNINCSTLKTKVCVTTDPFSHIGPCCFFAGWSLIWCLRQPSNTPGPFQHIWKTCKHPTINQLLKQSLKKQRSIQTCMWRRLHYYIWQHSRPQCLLNTAFSAATGSRPLQFWHNHPPQCC